MVPGGVPEHAHAGAELGAHGPGYAHGESRRAAPVGPGAPGDRHNTRYTTLEKRFRDMARVQMTASRLDPYLARVFPNPSVPDDDRAEDRVRRDRMWSAYFFDQGKGNRVQGVTGALWAAYNCVVEYVDHRASEQQTPERRLNSVWFGDGYLAQARAFRVAESLVGTWSN